MLAGANDGKTKENSNITQLGAERWPKHALAGVRLYRERKASALRSRLKRVPNHCVVVEGGGPGHGEHLASLSRADYLLTQRWGKMANRDWPHSLFPAFVAHSAQVCDPPSTIAYMRTYSTWHHCRTFIATLNVPVYTAVHSSTVSVRRGSGGRRIRERRGSSLC